MNCNDILKIKGISENIRLYGGEKGLARQIRWVYFADSMWWEKDYSPSDFIRGGELVFAINVDKLYDEEKLIEMMRMTNKKVVAGYVMDDGKITDKLIACADELELPLLGINEKVKLVDFSMTLCRMLLEEKQDQSIDNLFSSILFNEEISREEIIYKCSQYGIDSDRKSRAVMFRLIINDSNKDEMHSKRKSIKERIRKHFISAGMRYVPMFTQQGMVSLMVPADKFDTDRLMELCSDIAAETKNYFGIPIYVGIGDICYDLNHWRESYNQAKKATLLANSDDQIVFYSQIGLYSLIMQVKDTGFLRDFYMQRLQPILEFDSIKDSALCATLETYIECSGNAIAAAEKLFIHRNTMRYRLDKIETLLCCKLSDWEVCTELNAALKVKKYLELID